MARKQQTVVVEDMVVSKSCPGGRHIFTGGKSVLELPFTVSFMCEGDFTVHVDHRQVVVRKIDKSTISPEDTDEARAIADAYHDFP